MRTTSTTTLTFTPLDAPFGAEVRGLTWDEPSSETVGTITRWLRSKLLLVFRGQDSPTREQLDGFFSHFGRLQLHTYDGAFHYGTFTDAATEFVQRRDDTNYVVNVEQGAEELPWHNDQSHRPQLKVLSVLEALEVEDDATPTEFRDMYVAYEMLPVDLRARLAHKQGVFFNPRQPPPSEQPRLADAMHLVFTPHPHSGRVALYVNGYTQRIAGFDLVESIRLLTLLERHAAQHAPRYVHAWRTGDLVVWDNVGLQHRRPRVAAGERRTLRQYEGVAE